VKAGTFSVDQLQVCSQRACEVFQHQRENMQPAATTAQRASYDEVELNVSSGSECEQHDAEAMQSNGHPDSDSDSHSQSDHDRDSPEVI
jgi:hypothetical protein